MFKKGLSPVIGVVLLIMITVVAAGLIVSFVVPLVTDGLGKSQACLDALGELSIAPTQYNCYDSDVGDDGQTGFSIRINSDQIVGFSASLLSEGRSDVVKVVNEGSSGRLRMLGGEFNEELELPKDGGIRTYVTQGNIEKVEIFPLLEDDHTCDKADQVIINMCDGVSLILGSDEINAP